MTGATVKNSVTLEATYRIPDLPDDSVIGKTETITVAGKTVSSIPYQTTGTLASQHILIA